MNISLLLADSQGFFFGLGSVALIIALVLSVFWIWAIVDCAVNPRLDGVQKIVWLLVIFFLHILGAIIYAIVGRNTRGQLQTS